MMKVALVILMQRNWQWYLLVEIFNSRLCNHN